MPSESNMPDRDRPTVDLPPWNHFDTSWTIGLFGTAVGAGILFLPITAGMGGFWPLLAGTLLIGPMAYLAHRALSRMICESPHPSQDITQVVSDYFGVVPGRVITLLYFLAIYPIVLIYGVGITNTVDSLMVNQLGMASWPRWLLSGILVGLMAAVMFAGKGFMLKVTQWVVYPLIIILALITLYLIPSWTFEGFAKLPSAADFSWHLWVMIPVLVFAFNFSPAVSQFSVSLQDRYGANASGKASGILRLTVLLLVLFTMGFVWSSVLVTGPEGLAQARADNVPILSHLANQMGTPFIAWLGPIVAIAAIASSFFGHWLGAHEGAVGLLKGGIVFAGEREGAGAGERKLNIAVSIFLAVTTWLAGVLNPGILGLIETMVGPIIAIVLFLLPMYAIYRVPALARFRGDRIANTFVVISGLVALGGIFLAFLRMTGS